jgi:hypothetical protein
LRKGSTSRAPEGTGEIGIERRERGEGTTGHVAAVVGVVVLRGHWVVCLMDRGASARRVCDRITSDGGVARRRRRCKL